MKQFIEVAFKSGVPALELGSSSTFIAIPAVCEILERELRVRYQVLDTVVPNIFRHHLDKLEHDFKRRTEARSLRADEFFVRACH
ncbi:hypothetical protein AB595_10235 [Massilia sp. WF1]|nr:hypothetical protein AM586_27300 [Massilia sp. WG5]KLU36802.1 hypothetical protein AB595_10235 [Massilia sp. WF1]